MAHKKPTEYHVRVNGAGAIIIWRTGYKEFFPGKKIIYRNAYEPCGRAIWRIGTVKGFDKKDVLHLKDMGIKPVVAPIPNKRGKYETVAKNDVWELSRTRKRVQVSEPLGSLFTWASSNEETRSNVDRSGAANDSSTAPEDPGRHYLQELETSSYGEREWLELPVHLPGRLLDKWGGI